MTAVKRRWAGLCLGAFMLACSAPVAESPRGANERLAALGWLTGTWIGPSPQGTWEARYTSPDGGMMLSANKELVDGRAVSFELEQFYLDGDDVVLQPFVKGVKSPASFRLTDLDPTTRRAVFENPEHDFPQIITYHRTTDTTLSIKVQARSEGELRGFELKLTRQD